MFTYRSARTVIVGAALTALTALGVAALAGCGGSGSGAHPDVSMGVGASSSTSTGATAADASDAPGSGANGGTSSVTSNSIVAPASIPFPVAVGDTWVYQSTTAIDGTNSLTTNKIVSAVPTAGGYQVTMYQTTGLAGSVTTVRQVYIFYPDGTIGYPVTGANGVSVTGSSGVRWPDAAGLAAGRVYHSVLPVRVSQAGGSYTNADVTVQSAGTATVTVPAGTYRATVVDMTITTKVGRFSTTTEVETWLTPGTGPVKSEVLVHAGGNTKLITTNRLLSFTRGAVRADGS